MDTADAELQAAILASQQSASATLPSDTVLDCIGVFEGVAGVGGRTAEYYVSFALSHGLLAEDAISRYFDSGCASPPDDYVSTLFKS
jgi:hypothetical protein